MNAFTFLPPPPSTEAEALRTEARDFLARQLATRGPVQRAELWTGMNVDFSRAMGQLPRIIARGLGLC